MLRRKGKTVSARLVLLMCITGVCISPSVGQSAKHLLTPTEDIGLTLLYQYGSGAVPSGGEVIKFSSDKRYFAVVSERGNLETNKPEDVIWLFSVAEIESFVRDAGQGALPAAIPLVTVSSEKKGPFITDVRWLPDSSSIVFKQPMKSSRSSFHQLWLVDIHSRELKAVTPEDQDVGDFDVRTKLTYVYEVSAPKLLHTAAVNADSAVVQTGKDFGEILVPWLIVPNLSPFPEAGLWLVEDGKSRQILDSKEKLPSEIRLSPDGRYLLGTLREENPPTEWSKYQGAPAQVEVYGGAHKFAPPTSTYYLFDLSAGRKKQLFNAPEGRELGWYSGYGSSSSWSPDGKSLILGNVFLPLDNTDANDNAERIKHPYVAVYRLDTGRVSGLLPVVSGANPKRYFLGDAFFQDSRTVVLKFDKKAMQPPLYVGPSIAVFHEDSDRFWKKVSESDDDPRLAELPIKVQEKEGINQPPIIVATDKATGNSFTVWDPNPQLKNVDLGDAKVVSLSLPGFYPGQEMGLVFPPDYVPGKRYPLVIQTHGFNPHQFLTSGIYSTPFAARAMAARGIIVAQIEGTGKDEESVRAIDSVIETLSKQGLVDDHRVGAIGFSATVWWIMSHMAFGTNRLAAASILDGIDGGYLQNILWPLDDESRHANGGTPFGGEGLKNWIVRSPMFNTDKMHTPLLILAFGASSGNSTLEEQWEAYSTLYQQHKPVELITLAAPWEHPSTNPKNRLYCETFNSDWFDFWLNNHEDPDPAKAEQYKRWREMRKIQEENEKKSRETSMQGTN